MSYILIGSPDKISMGAFLRHIRRYFPDHQVGDLHSLMTPENINLYVKDFSIKFPNGIFTYYAKRSVSKDPKTCLPEEVFKMADVIIWFDLYSNDPIVLKDSDGSLNVAIDNWNKYIQSIS